MLKTYWRPETGIFLVLWLGLLFAGQSRLLRDPGTFWHTVVGDHILSTGEFVTTDSFSFTFAGQPWIAYHWLSECLMAAVYRVDGFDGLLLITVTALAVLYTWAAHRLIRAGLHRSVTIVFIVLTIAASAHNWHIRPHLFTLVFLGCIFGHLCDVEAGLRSLRSLVWLPLWFVAWTNLHGGVLGGLGTVGLVFAGWSAARLVGIPSPVSNFRQMLLLGGLVVVCGLTVFVNPYGAETPRFWLTIMGLDLPDIIQEHAPLNPTDLTGISIIGLMVIYVFMLAGTLPRWPRITWLLPLLWFYLSCTRNRHGPLFAITAVLAMADMLPHTRWAQWLARRGSDLFQSPDREGGVGAPPSLTVGARKYFLNARAALLPILIVILAITLQLAHVAVPLIGYGWARPDPAYWPVELRPTLEEIEPGTPIFNDLLYGGYVIFYAPRLRVFIDDRCELYKNDFLRAYANAEQQDAAQLETWRKQYGFRYALTRVGTPFDQYLSKADGWRIVKETPTATLFEYSEPRP